MLKNANMVLNANVQEPDLVQSQSTEYVCPICQCQYPSEQHFYDHLHIHTGDKNHRQSQQDNVAVGSQEKKLKLLKNVDNNVAKPFKCQQCNLTFDRASQLDYHRRSIHLGEKSQLCQVCGKGFFRKTDLRTHLNIHLGTNLYICEVCGRKFNHISNLIRHCRMHAGVKPYPCSTCGKRFTQISSLARHKQHIHDRSKESGEKLFGRNLASKDGKQKEKLLSIDGSERDVQKQDNNEQRSTIDAENYHCTTVNDLFQKLNLPMDSPVNMEHVKTENQRKSFVENERNSKDTNNATSVINRDEPMLRLVQTETGEQFYELIITNFFVEKIPTIQHSKTSENSENHKTTTCLNNKDQVNQVIDREQDLREINHMDNNPSYTDFELHRQDNENEQLFCTITKTKDYSDSSITKNQTSHVHSENQEQLLETTDPQTDFDSYVEANFEVFEKLNYENNSERLFELVEIAESGLEISMYKESSIPRFPPNEGEQFFELLQDSRAVDKNQNKDFTEIDRLRQHEIVYNNSCNDEQVLLTCLKDQSDKRSSENNNDCTMKQKNEKERNWKKVVEESKKKEAANRESKKSKIFLLKFQCTVCEKSFSSSYNYKQHIGTHFADQQNFHCKECKLSFAWKSTLNKHIANNHKTDGQQKCACKICPKFYNTLSQVNEHVKRDHLKQRNHTCSHCGKSFFKKYDLKIHNRIHTDERPYVCRSCGKKFHHRSHIIRHERIHI